MVWLQSGYYSIDTSDHRSSRIPQSSNCKKSKNEWTCLVDIIVDSYLDNIHTFTSISSICFSEVSSFNNITEEIIIGFNYSTSNNSTTKYCKLIWRLLVPSVNACSHFYALERLKDVRVSPMIFSTAHHSRININEGSFSTS